MRKLIYSALLIVGTTAAHAQGYNTGMGGDDSNTKSLTEKVLKLQKKNNLFNVFIDFAAAAHATDESNAWKTGFADRQLRLEIKGNITPKLYYRLRHRLNSSNRAETEDNFSRATDMMFIGYKFNDKLSVQAGKICRTWGGFEYEENPLFIYKYSDFVGHTEAFLAGAVASFKPTPTQEIAVEISDTYTSKFKHTYGNDARIKGEKNISKLEESNNPLTYIINWNGNFADNKLQTRWAAGLQTLARHQYARSITMGQKLNLKSFQCYIDYMAAFDGLDRLGIASNDLRGQIGENVYLGSTHYHSIITKANWQIAPKWNLMLKGTYETASATKTEQYKNYRKSYGYLASIEYYPIKEQNLRLFLAYMGQKVDFSAKSKLNDYHNNRIELGFMYRLKCY